ncbi:MAG: exopolygalacturonase, partial [Duncaniella sp.]|nr:exopolygalacturonase [Duncaniella sp.]
VNDDAVCLKGGKGTWVDTIVGNGPVGNVIIDRCHFRNTNAGVTFGSEAWDCSNVILNDCTFDNPHHVLLFKMRPDTPQRYRNVLVSGVKGSVRSAVEVQPWRQFYDKADRDPMPESSVSNVTCRDMDVTCSKAFFSKGKLDGAYKLSDFTFENIKANEPDGVGFDTEGITDCVVKNVVINGVKY